MDQRCWNCEINCSFIYFFSSSFFKIIFNFNCDSDSNLTGGRKRKISIQCDLCLDEKKWKTMIELIFHRWSSVKLTKKDCQFSGERAWLNDFSAVFVVFAFYTKSINHFFSFFHLYLFNVVSFSFFRNVETAKKYKFPMFTFKLVNKKKFSFAKLLFWLVFIRIFTFNKIWLRKKTIYEIDWLQNCEKKVEVSKISSRDRLFIFNCLFWFHLNVYIRKIECIKIIKFNPGKKP